MPTQIALPACLTDVYHYLFPTIDWDRVKFFEGLPPLVDADGFTMVSGSEVHVYLKQYQPCDSQTFLIIAHELVHVLQIQELFFGGRFPGWWTTRYVATSVCAGFSGGCDNAFEREAYEYANGCGSTPGRLQACIAQPPINSQSPCQCAKMTPWPTERPIPGTSYIDALGACPDLIKSKSTADFSWCSLLSPILWPIVGGFSVFGFSGTGGLIGSGLGVLVGGIIGWVIGCALLPVLGCVLGALLGAFLGGIIGGAIGWVIDHLFSGPSASIWFTALDGNQWIIPDVLISRDGHSLTSRGPALAVFGNSLYLAYRSNGDDGTIWRNILDPNTGWEAQDAEVSSGDHTLTSDTPALASYNGKLYLAYRGGGDDSMWYNEFDGTNWWATDQSITQSGHTRSSFGPALAEYNGQLYMAYRGSASDEIWYNVFDGANWLTNDLKISQNGHTLTSARPALAVYQGKLYLVYRASGDDTIWYNVFDGSTWLTNDVQVSQGGHTRTSDSPALAVHAGQLYLAYKGSGDGQIWYNVFDGASWNPQDTKISVGDYVRTGYGPALADFGGYLFLVYRDDS